MTAAFLQSELASLIQDSKRRQSDVRTAAEKSLADLKSIQVTSETQLAGDLLRRAHFIDPFILACNSKHVKLALTGAICLQRLIASKAIAPSRLLSVLDAFQEATQQGVDVQLKILQALPSLLQLYTTEIQGEALGKILSLCASLVGSKSPIVSNTANATFQQLIAALFEQQAPSKGLEQHGHQTNHDVAAVFNDMSMVIKGEEPQFLRPQGITIPLALEVIELCLSNEAVTVLEIPNCLATCEASLVPGIIQILERSTSFSTFGRGLRIIYLLVTRDLDRVLESLSEAFSVILYIMDRPAGPPWRRILCLEFMRGIISDPQLFRTIYALFDGDKSKNAVIGALMSILVRVAAEDPALIGLGRQSTIPTNTEEDNAGTGGGAVDVDAVGSVLQASSNVTGISSKWSTLGSPLLEQLDKQTTPDIPATYIYTIVLGCVAAFSDGLSKYVMPLSVPNRVNLDDLEAGDTDTTPKRKNSQVKRTDKYQRLLNPLKRDDLGSKDEIQACAKLIEECWPAILATCSTFLNSALDSYFYHILVRTVQKLAQVSGVLELFTPRDALLTTLAKVSVPINVSSIITALHGNKLAKSRRDGEDYEADEMSLKSPINPSSRLSVDMSRQPLNIRNLLCLRALLNLGIALGPTLSETSWFIIIQALQQVDALMSVNPSTRGVGNKSQGHEDADGEGQLSLGSEITAVGTASKRMLESTRSYSDEAFEILVRSAFKMADNLATATPPANTNKGSNGIRDLAIPSRKHEHSRSVSSMQTSVTILHIEAEFVLKTINDLARINLHRFCSDKSQACTWDLIVIRLLSIVADININSEIRVQAATTLNAISTETARVLEKRDQGSDVLDMLQNLYLSTLSNQLALLYTKGHASSILAADVDIHRRILEALENIVSNSGDSLTSGWRIVFEILQKTTRQTEEWQSANDSDTPLVEQEVVLERTLPSAFRTIQLIVSDFLSTIDPLSFSILVQILPLFGSQKNDLNIALTTTVLFSNLSSLLLERTGSLEVPPTTKSNMSSSNKTSVTTEREAVDVSSLWFQLILQLCSLCKDDRSEVRNSALRVLFLVFESASSQITPTTWNVSLREALLPVLEEYSGRHPDASQWHMSYSQFLEGIVGLFVQNVETITQYATFTDTWVNLISALENKLSEQTLESHTVVWSAVANLLRALNSTKALDEQLLFSVLRCWSDNHPAEIVNNEKSNQDALYAYGQLYSAIMEAPNNTMGKFSWRGKTLVELAMVAVKRTMLASIHPPYSSDINKMSPEQVVITANLTFIKEMTTLRNQKYTAFLLDLIDNILTRNQATEAEHGKIGTGPKSLKRPTLIALMAYCITDIRDIVREGSTNNNVLEGVSIQNALAILNRVVATKYTNLPSSNDQPVWKNATSATVELMEVIPSQITNLRVEDIKSLAGDVAQAIEAILTAPTLEVKAPPPSSDTITSDETFDIEHAKRFYNASLSMLQHPEFPPQQLQRYILVLFNASLTAKPWFGDFPPNFPNNPVSTLKELRPGTIRAPDYLPRTRIPYESLDALLGLVDRKTLTEPSNNQPPTTAEAAAPFILLRLAHSIKVFLADQRLRNLIPPPRPILRELNVVLTKALELRTIPGTFSKSGVEPEVAGESAAFRDDGKKHLRILYPLILRLNRFWSELPRLKVCAWQDSEDGKAIQRALDGWGGVLTEGWGIE